MPVLAGHPTYVNKAVILEISNPAIGGDPNSPALVLKEGLDGVIRQPAASLAVNSDLPVLPPVQAFTSAKPNAAISGRQDGPNSGNRQALFTGNCRDREVAKAVEAS